MIKITCDSVCDLPSDILDEYNISTIPLGIVVDDKIFYDGVNITSSDIFNYVDHKGKKISTSAVNVSEYLDFFEKFSGDYTAVIHISLSDMLSSSCQNALIAAKSFNNVYIVNSKSISTGVGMLGIKAAKMAQENMPPLNIVKTLVRLKSKLEASLVIDKLDYLHRGGRCSSIALLGANLLRLRPCIEVREGKLIVSKKFRGSLSKCIESFIVDRLKGRTDIDLSTLFITYSTLSDSDLNLVREAVLNYTTFENTILSRTGCTMSSHCGPNTIGLVFLKK